MKYRDYTYLGSTQSLCPECLELLPAKIVEREGRVYFRKHCREHGPREDFVCSDARWFDRHDYSLPGKVPEKFGVEPTQGCPFDCGLCTEHEQHTCLGLLEITSACNLDCPMCFAASGPGGNHLTVDECRRAIDRLVEVEGQPEILQLSGGEPTIHPNFFEIFEYACAQPIDIVMINTNGIRLAHDQEFLERVAALKHRAEIYLQFDGLNEDSSLALRGESLLEIKLKAIEKLGEAGLRTTLVCTLQAGVNEGQIGPIVDFGVRRPWVTGVSFQPATYVGRYVLPAELERRVTFPDVFHHLVEQSPSYWQESDFSPLPCAHPNGHSLAYAYRSGEDFLPLARFVDLANHLDLLAGRITFNRQRASVLVSKYLSRISCCADGSCGGDGQLVQIDGVKDNPNDQEAASGASRGGGLGASSPSAPPDERSLAIGEDFFRRAMAEDLDPEDVFRVTTTSFMDAYNFDVRQLMKSCVHHVLPSGHVIPFSAYNVLYREGHVPLPPLVDGAKQQAAISMS